MFTGLIQAVSKIIQVQEIPSGDRVYLERPMTENFQNLTLGESISVSGACLTITEIGSDYLTFERSTETKSIATLHTHVNLERACTPTTLLGGHLVSGHVDALAEIQSIEKYDNFQDWRVSVPQPLLKFIVKKGSICLEGVSLTVNDISNDILHLMLIPHTISSTSFQFLHVKDKINCEVDQIAKFVDNLRKYS